MAEEIYKKNIGVTEYRNRSNPLSDFCIKKGDLNGIGHKGENHRISLEVVS